MTQQMFDKDVETILKEKIAYHQELASFHHKQAEDTKAALTAIQSPKMVPVPLITPNEQKTDSLRLPVDMNFSVPVWRPRVEKVLKSANFALKTEEIVRLVDERYLQDEETRKQAIGVVSSVLYALGERGIIIKSPGDGRGNLYKWGA